MSASLDQKIQKAIMFLQSIGSLVNSIAVQLNEVGNTLNEIIAEVNRLRRGREAQTRERGAKKAEGGGEGEVKPEELKTLIIDALMTGASCLCDQCYWSPDDCPVADLAKALGAFKSRGILCRIDWDKLRARLEEVIEVKAK